MLRRLIVMILVIGLLPSIVSAATSVSQHGITWTWEEDRQVGQFANGDYWVVGPITITDIDPASTDDGSRVMHGSMINPSPTDGSSQGYDTILHQYGSINIDSYRLGMNVARPNGQDLSAGNPLIVQAGSSLVSTISFPTSNRPQVQTAAILTVLASAPPAGSFRPPYSGNDKTIHFNVNDLDYSVLGKLTPPPGHDNELIDNIPRIDGPWIDHIPDFYARYQHPADHMPDYSRTFSSQEGDIALALNLDYTDSEKEALLIRFVQLGIDNYRNIELGIPLPEGNWPPREGQNMGRKLPIVFAGKVLGGVIDGSDEASRMLHVGNWWTSGAVFQEDLNVFRVEQSDVGRHVIGVNTGCNNCGVSCAPEYTNSHVGLPEWGSRHYGPDGDVCRDNADFNANYRDICATGMLGSILAIHIMDLYEPWNNQILLDYLDRWWFNTNSGTGQSLSGFTRDMYTTYRDDFGCTWTDVNQVSRESIYDCDSVSVDCSSINSCSDYPNQVAIDYDPCGVDCLITSPPIPGNWELVFNDEFGGSSLDSDKWHTCFWWADADEYCTIETNNELELYTPWNVLVEDGLLKLRAQEEDLIWPFRNELFHYTSGMVMTGGRYMEIPPGFTFTYGYMESRMKVPSGNGFWSAFWTLPIDYEWPPEIDITEILGDSTSTHRMHYHYPGGVTNQNWVGPDFSQDWHMFAVDWEPDKIVWYVDGIERYRFEDAGDITSEPMYLLLNLAVGGDWPEPPDGSTVFPNDMLVDYVRVWQLSEPPQTCSGDCCTGLETCYGIDLGTFSDCPGVCCSQACEMSSDCLTSTTTFQTTQIDQQNGVFTVEFNATPGEDAMNGVIALADGPGSVYSDFAVLVRFNDSNFIEARYGSLYRSNSSLSYSAGTKYHVKLAIDIPANNYSVNVTPEGGSEQTIAYNFPFRTEQTGITKLDHWGLIDIIGYLDVCDFQITSSQGSYHRADSDVDGCIDNTELFTFMNRWRVSIADVGMVEMMEAIELWKLGDSCS